MPLPLPFLMALLVVLTVPSALAGTTATSDPPGAKLAGRGVNEASRSRGAGFTWPLAPHPVVRGFAPGAHPWSPGHRGVDLLGTAGQVVAAAGAGVVSYVGSIAGVPLVALTHPGGVRTTYQPVVAGVTLGAAVPRGAALGRLVSTGTHCAPRTCLHWGALLAQTYLDPVGLLDRGHPILLPGPSRP